MELMESLLKLSQVDAQVRGLRSRLQSAQRYLDTQTRQLGDLNQQLQELQTRRKHMQATIANHESEMATIDERIEKLRDELNSSVTNKQYSAVLTELNTIKANRSEIETQEIGELELVESVEAEIKTIQSHIEERSKMRDLAAVQLKECESEIGQRLVELETEREQAADDVPMKALDIFDTLADIYEGEAMASIKEVSFRHREYACGACNIQLPFETVSVLMGGVSTVVRCTACTRILYLQDEVRGALVKK